MSVVNQVFLVADRSIDCVNYIVFVDLEGAAWNPDVGGPVHSRGTFDNIAKALPEYATFNISVYEQLVRTNDCVCLLD